MLKYLEFKRIAILIMPLIAKKAKLAQLRTMILVGTHLTMMKTSPEVRLMTQCSMSLLKIYQ